MAKSQNTIPGSWTSLPLGEVGQWSGGGTPSKSRPEFWTGGSIPWVSPKDMKPLHIADTQDHITQVALAKGRIGTLPASTVMVVVRSGILQHSLPVAVADVPVTLNQDLKGVTPPEGIDPDFLAWGLRRHARDILHLCCKTGTTVQSIELPALKAFEIPLAPLAEQERIVDKIDELFTDLDAAEAALVRAQAKLKRYRASVLKAAVEGRLTAHLREQGQPFAPGQVESAEDLLERILVERKQRWVEAELDKWRSKQADKGWNADKIAAAEPKQLTKIKAKYKQPAAPDTTDLPELPQGWCWATMEQMGGVRLGRQRSPKNRSQQYPTKYIRAANITEDGLDLSDVLDMEFRPSERETYALRDGDLIVSEASGSPDQVGKPAAWRDQLPLCCFQNTVIRLRPDGVRSDYLLVGLRSHYVSGAMKQVAAGGAGLNHLSAGKFSLMPMPLPPLAEQEAIIEIVDERLTQCQAAERAVEAALARAKRLRQAILKRAFEGKLVPQEPTDEPATELLARIAAQRSEEDRKTCSRKRRNSL